MNFHPLNGAGSGCRLCLAIVLSALVFSAPNAVMAAELLPWHKTRAAGIREAQLQKRPILVRFGGDSCPWCRRLDKEIEKPSVQQALKRWTLVELDVEKAGNDARTLNVGPIPALRVLTPTGILVQ